MKVPLDPRHPPKSAPRNCSVTKMTSVTGVAPEAGRGQCRGQGTRGRGRGPEIRRKGRGQAEPAGSGQPQVQPVSRHRSLLKH